MTKNEKKQFDMFMVDIYRWQWNVEADYKNQLVACQNRINSMRWHNMNDYIELYELELQLKHFKLFCRELTSLLEMFYNNM